MKTATYIHNMRYLEYHSTPDEFGDTVFSCDCNSLSEAKRIIKDTGIEQNLIIYKRQGK